jgi:hypothetical protein
MTIYLYKKTHNKTGLQYLGKTVSPDPQKYQGSGKWWMHHINKHGYDVTTEIIKECQTNEELKEWGKYYSKLWDIVASKDWANIREESGDGGFVAEPWNKGKQTGPQSPDMIAKRSAAMKGRPAHNKGIPNPNISEANKRRAGIPRTGKDKEAISKGGKGKKMTTVTCPHCIKIGGRGNMHRYHFENCKYLTTKINTQ